MKVQKMQNFIKPQNATRLATRIVVFLIIFLSSIFCFMPTESASAKTSVQSNFSQLSVSDSYFSLNMTVEGRHSNALPENIQTVTNSIGQEINYYCFQWRDIVTLNFSITASLSSTTKSFTSVKFLLTNIQTDDINEDVNQAVSDVNFRTLYQGAISNNTFPRLNITFHVDKKCRRHRDFNAL